MIPPALLAGLGRFLPHLALGAALLFGIWQIDQSGYRRAKQDTDSRQLVDQVLRERATRRVEKALSDGLGEIDRRAAARITEIDTTHRNVIQPALTKEIARDPRYSDPAAGVSRGMLDALNRARNASRPAAARPDR